MKCSIIIPVFNRAGLTRRCLDALLAQPPQVEAEIIVVDDGSTDETGSLLREYGARVQVVTHDGNKGFAAACNDGAQAAASEYLVFLNNDTMPQPGWLDALAAYADAHPTVAAVGSKLLFPNDTIQHAGVVIGQDHWPRHIYAGFPADHPAVNKSRRYPIVTAACALFRRAPFEAAGGFDTAFMNGIEDVDLCLRLGEQGHAIHYCHTSVLYHLETVSERMDDTREHNKALYIERWLERVQPDDIHYYLEDGLLRITYPEMTYSTFYPVRFSISPLLGVVDDTLRAPLADELLARRSREMFELLKENIRLSVRAREKGLEG